MERKETKPAEKKEEPARVELKGKEEPESKSKPYRLYTLDSLPKLSNLNHHKAILFVGDSSDPEYQSEAEKLKAYFEKETDAVFQTVEADDADEKKYMGRLLGGTAGIIYHKAPSAEKKMTASPVAESVVKYSHQRFLNELNKVANEQGNPYLMAAMMANYSGQIESFDPEMSTRLLERAGKIIDV